MTADAHEIDEFDKTFAATESKHREEMQSIDLKARFHDADSVLDFFKDRKAKEAQIQLMTNLIHQAATVATLLAANGFGPNNNQQAMAVWTAHTMTRHREARSKQIVVFPAGHGKSRIVPTFIKLMSMNGEAHYVRVIFNHREQMEHDMPIIRDLLKDDSHLRVEFEVLQENQKEIRYPSNAALHGKKPLLIVDEFDHVVLDREVRIHSAYNVLGLTASTEDAHTVSERIYLTRTLSYTWMASNVQNQLEPFDPSH